MAEKKLSGLESTKHYAQQSLFRIPVKRNGMLRQEKCQMCMTDDDVAILSGTSYDLQTSIPWPLLSTISIEPKNEEDFTVNVLNQKKKKYDKITFSSPKRSTVVCRLYYFKHMSNPSTSPLPPADPQDQAADL